MPKVNIKFNTIKQEQERVKNVLDNLEFFKKNNYNVGLPMGIDNLSGKEIDQAVASEYAPDKYQMKIKELGTAWSEMEADFFIKAENILKKNPLPEYHCFITKYGTGGSYNPPDKIIMNINSQNFGVFTIPHEIIHLLIHDLIEKYKIDHWSKERLVDLYLFQILGFDKFQPIQDQDLIKKVDSAYQKFAPEGVEKVIKNIN
jgi:hypothetical protein